MATRHARTDHLAFVTGDTAATVDFYERVLGWALVGAHRGVEPDGRRFFISDFQGDGWLLEFEEIEGRPTPSPQAEYFPHFGLDVGDAATFEAWLAHLDEHDVAYDRHGPTECFLADPNGVSFQLFVKESTTTGDKPAEARRMVDDWIAGR